MIVGYKPKTIKLTAVLLHGFLFWFCELLPFMEVSFYHIADVLIINVIKIG